MSLDSQIEAVWAALEPVLAHWIDDPGFYEDEVRAAIRQALTPPSLDDYQLILGEKVKFVADGKKNKQPGTVAGINADSSILINDGRRAFSRSIVASNVYREIPGPRGGSKWLPVTSDLD